MDSSNNRGIWAQRYGGLELVARTGNHAPGTPEGVYFEDFWAPAGPALNSFGQTAFRANLTGPGVDPAHNFGIWSESSGFLALEARSGNQAPGMPDGAVFAFIGHGTGQQLGFNSTGQTAFWANVTGGGVDTTNNEGIWSESSGALALVAREGNHAPGTPDGVNFGGTFGAYPQSPPLNDAGQIAFFATLTGAGVDSNNNLGLWSGAFDSLALIARTGEHTPGTPDGVVFGDFTRSPGQPTFSDRILMLNAAGQTAFVGSLTENGVSAGLGIWAADRGGALQLISRTGDSLEVAPGDFRTVSSLAFLGDAGSSSTGNSDGRPSAFNNRGQLAFSAQFTDGSSGIFVSNRVAVPEPSSLLLVATGFLGLVGRAPRRQRHCSDQQNGRTTTAQRALRSSCPSCLRGEKSFRIP